jgi:integrase/recombinase XerC
MADIVMRAHEADRSAAALERIWYGWLAARSAAPDTQRAYRDALRRASSMAVRLGYAWPQGIDATAARAIYAALVGERGAINTANLTLAACRGAWDALIAAGVARENPWRTIRPRRARVQTAERILTEAEVRRLWQAAGEGPGPGAANRAVLATLYYGGLRVAEACELRWRDLHRVGQQWRATVYGKGGKTRYVWMHPAWVAALRALPRPASPDAPILGLSPRGVRWLVAQWAARAGLGKAVSPHWLRHSFASALAAHGMPMRAIQELLGHADIATTARYVHLMEPVRVEDYLPDLGGIGSAQTP